MNGLKLAVGKIGYLVAQLYGPPKLGWLDTGGPTNREAVPIARSRCLPLMLIMPSWLHRQGKGGVTITRRSGPSSGRRSDATGLLWTISFVNRA